MGLTRLFAHPSGALYLPDEGALLLADLHLGYAWAQRRRGELGPITDGGVAAKLAAVLDEVRPASVVLLGDVVHAPKPSPQERAWIVDALGAIPGRLIVVRGNHDRALTRDFGIPTVTEWRAPGIVAVHGDRLPDTAERIVMGHLHPFGCVRDLAGATRRVPVFHLTARAVTLPAFSPLAAGVTVKGGRQYAATGKRVLPLARPTAAQSRLHQDRLVEYPSMLRIF